MLPTPSTSHVDTNCIYEPSEDSFLLLDTLSSKSEIAFLTERFCERGIARNNGHSSPSPVIVEVGIGSGVVLAFVTANAGTIFGREDVFAFGTDVNAFACLATKKTVFEACSESSNTEGTAVTTPLATAASLASALCADLTGPLRFGVADVLIFNPPYVPTAHAPSLRVDKSAEKLVNSDTGIGDSIRSYDHDSYLLSLSYAGGVDGMEITNRLLQELPLALNRDRGVAYVLLCQQNRPEDVIDRIKTWGTGWNVVTVGNSEKKAGWEKLIVIRIWRFS